MTNLAMADTNQRINRKFGIATHAKNSMGYMAETKAGKMSRRVSQTAAAVVIDYATFGERLTRRQLRKQVRARMGLSVISWIYWGWQIAKWVDFIWGLYSERQSARLLDEIAAQSQAMGLYDDTSKHTTNDGNTQ